MRTNKFRFQIKRKRKGDEEVDDEKITEMLWQRDETALRLCSERFGRLAYSLAYNILHIHEDAEECVNDAMLAAWNTIPPQRPKSLSAYISRLVRNISFNRYDYNHAEKRNGEMDLILDELAEVIPSEETEESGAITAAINEFLESESELDRAIFVRRYYYSDPISAVAAYVGVGESAAAMRLSRMRGRLRKKLEREGISI